MSDLAFYSFVQKLNDLMKINGKQLLKRDRFFPSSKTHFECGYVNHNLTLNDREWVCPQCGATVHRDVNAVLMIKHGRAMSWSGESVRQAEPATLVEAQESPSL